jgi:hypothetical protein
VHEGGFILFRPMVQELSNNIEQFFQRKFIKIKKIKIKIKDFFSIVENPFMNGFLGGDFIIFRPKVGEILDFD